MIRMMPVRIKNTYSTLMAIFRKEFKFYSLKLLFLALVCRDFPPLLSDWLPAAAAKSFLHFWLLLSDIFLDI